MTIKFPAISVPGVASTPEQRGVHEAVAILAGQRPKTCAGAQLVATCVKGSRPTPVGVGQMLFDTALGYPIWCKQVTPPLWVNASGTVV